MTTPQRPKLLRLATPPQNFISSARRSGARAAQPAVRFRGHEGTRNEISRPYSFQVETPELRDYVLRTTPASVAARLLRQFPAPTPDPAQWRP